MTVVSTLDDPLAVLLTDNLSDVMTPDHNRAHRGTAGVAAIVRPGSREVVLGTRIGPHLTAHLPSAPGGRPPPAPAPIARMLIGRAPVSRTLIIRVPKARRPKPETKDGVPKP